ncbi:MAG: VTT domain-containing protein [Candidatus Ranarchaeia archaeon]
MDESDAAVVGILGASTSAVIVFQEVVVQQVALLSNSLLSLLHLFGYPCVFVIALLGNLFIETPIPYALSVFLFGLWGLNPIVLGASTALGSSIGNFIFYSYGKGISQEGAKRKFGKQFSDVSNFIGKNGFVTTLLYSMTPLPDDLLMVPLGVTKYNFRKAFIANFIGKTIYVSLIATLGYVVGFYIFIPITGLTLALSIGGFIMGGYMTYRIDWIDTANWFDNIDLFRNIKTTVLTKPYLLILVMKEFPIPVALISSLILMTFSLISGILLLQIVSVLSCTAIICYSVFVELMREY